MTAGFVWRECASATHVVWDLKDDLRDMVPYYKPLLDNNMCVCVCVFFTILRFNLLMSFPPVVFLSIPEMWTQLCPSSVFFRRNISVGCL